MLNTLIDMTTKDLSKFGNDSCKLTLIFALAILYHISHRHHV